MKLKTALAVAMASTLSLLTMGCATSVASKNVASQHVQVSQVKLDQPRLTAHLQALQDIANQHGGNRAVGTAGGQATAQYILNQAKKAGLIAQMLPFENRNKKVGQNVMIEIQGTSKDTAIIVGGHYDSVEMGPGMNDNGSGVAVLLELMDHYAKTKPKHTLYFAFWDSEEEGVGGSQAFVSKMTETQLKGIQAYINVDMVGTKNPNIQIADGDKSSLDEMEAMLKERGMKETEYKPLTDSLRSIPNHVGDLSLEKHMKAFFQAKGVQIKEDISTLTASDTAPFLGKVPVTSLILFNEQMKGDELEFAPCYHKACDNIDLIDPKSMQLAGEAVGYVIAQLNAK